MNKKYSLNLDKNVSFEYNGYNSKVNEPISPFFTLS